MESTVAKDLWSNEAAGWQPALPGYFEQPGWQPALPGYFEQPSWQPALLEYGDEAGCPLSVLTGHQCWRRPDALMKTNTTTGDNELTEIIFHNLLSVLIGAILISMKIIASILIWNRNIIQQLQINNRCLKSNTMKNPDMRQAEKTFSVAHFHRYSLLKYT